MRNQKNERIQDLKDFEQGLDLPLVTIERSLMPELSLSVLRAQALDQAKINGSNGWVLIRGMGNWTFAKPIARDRDTDKVCYVRANITLSNTNLINNNYWNGRQAQVKPLTTDNLLDSIEDLVNNATIKD